MSKQKNEIFNVTKTERKKLKGIKNTMKAIKGVRFNKWLFVGIVFFYVILIAISIIEALISKELLFSLTGSAWKRLASFAVAYVLLSVVDRLLGNVQSYLTTKFNAGVVCSLTLKGYERISMLQAKCFTLNTTNAFTSRVNESAKISTMFIFILNKVHALVTNIAYSIIFATTIPILFIIVLVFYLTRIILTEFLIIPKHQAIRKRNAENYTIAANTMMESIRGAMDIKGLNATDVFSRKFNSEYTLSQNNSVQIGIWRRNRMLPVTLATHDLNYLVFMLAAAYFGATGSFTAAAIVFAYTYQEYVYNFFSNFSDLRDHLADIETSSARYYELFDETIFPIEKFGTKEQEISGNISFKNVTFYYNKNQKVLDNVSFDIEANKITAFVGKTGCGKSTILSLIARFYDPIKGTIKADKTNLKQLSAKSLRSQIAYVQQDPYIFNATFKENLRFINENATDEEIIDACKRSEIHDFIMTTENGYDTLIGENGINLSGGQKQRLAIARAFINKAKVIMFDESTSALDNENQAKIQKTINKLTKDHTIIVVAHRLSTIKNADKIIFIDDSKISATGTHSELMKTCPGYKNLYKIENKNND